MRKRYTSARSYGGSRSRISTTTSTLQLATTMRKGKFIYSASSFHRRSKRTTSPPKKSTRRRSTNRHLAIPMVSLTSSYASEKKWEAVWSCSRRSRRSSTTSYSLRIGRQSRRKRPFRRWWRKWPFGGSFTQASSTKRMKWSIWTWTPRRPR